MGVLDGKSPRQVVGDPAGQIRVQAIILQMDLAEPVENPDLNKLRRSLGLPTIEPIEPEGVRVEALSPARQTRLIVEKLTDEQLIAVYRRAALSAAPRLFRKVGLEVVSRPSLDKHPQIDKGEAYDILSRMALDADEAVGFLVKAQEVAKAKGRSPARYMLAELPYRLQRGEEQESRRILELLTTKHAKEPGVAQALYGLLAQLGLMRTDPATGRPVMVIPSAGGGAEHDGRAGSPCTEVLALDSRPDRRRRCGARRGQEQAVAAGNGLRIHVVRRRFPLDVAGPRTGPPRPGLRRAEPDGRLRDRAGRRGRRRRLASAVRRRMPRSRRSSPRASRRRRDAVRHARAVLPLRQDAALHRGDRSRGHHARRLCDARSVSESRRRRLQQLESAGIAVEVGLLEAEARELNAPYLKLVQTGQPWVIAKWAMTLDGKIATRSGDSQWISSEASRADRPRAARPRRCDPRRPPHRPDRRPAAHRPT